MPLINLTEADKRVVTVSSITLVALALCLAGLGSLTKNSFGPIIIDNIFGLSKYVAQQSTKEVDSGYTKTFVFSESQDTMVTQTLLFYAKPDQDVMLHIDGASRGAEREKIQIKVDDVLIADQSGQHRTLPLMLHDRLPLSGETELGQDIHSLKILPVNSQVHGLIVIDAIVIVSNPTR